MRLAFDIETDGLLLDVSKVHCLVIKNIDTGEVTSCGATETRSDSALLPVTRGLDVLSRSSELIGHNIVMYDLPALKKVLGWSPTPSTRITDTLLCSRLIWTDLKDRDFTSIRKGRAIPPAMAGRHSLEAWGYRLGLLKDGFGKTTDWSEWSPEMQAYCARDVDISAKLYALIESKKYSPAAIELEHQFAAIIQQQIANGFCFDEKAAAELYAKLAARRDELRKNMEQTFEPTKVQLKTKVKYIPFNPGSRTQIAKRLSEKYGWKPTEFTDSGKAKVDETILESLPYPEAKVLAEYFMVEKRIGQIAEGNEAWLKRVRNGRIHGDVITNGAVTGRCTHSNPNVAQVPSVKNAKGVVPYGAECRSLFRASPLRVLVGADASGLELRCLAHYMARYDEGAYAKIVVGGDVHTENQKAAGLPSRQNAKTFIYAYLYGAGDWKLGHTVDPGATDSKKKSLGKKLRTKFLEAIPALAKLTAAVKAAAKKNGYLPGLDGRRLHVRSEHAALNTLLQSAGALVMKKALVIFKQKLDAMGLTHGVEYGFVANIHDEIQFEATQPVALMLGAKCVLAIREAGEAFGLRCPIDGEAKIGDTWCQTH